MGVTFQKLETFGKFSRKLFTIHYLVIKIRDLNSKIVAEFEVSPCANNIEGFFHDYEDSLYILRQDLKVTDFISENESKKFHFKDIDESGEHFIGTTDFFSANEFLSYVEKVMEHCYIKIVDATTEYILETTKWQMTKDSHPARVRAAVSGVCYNSNLIKLYNLVLFSSKLNYDVQFTAIST